ncbi:MAG TPA: DUF2062 domain-containing protein [Alphaproteobacteria bacterium]|nr:DUF2062 domain-containing protein [Alphaproteobacteria bacterium]
MLFKRKKKQSLLSKLRDIVWPKSGWKRTFLYLKHRILRLPHSTHSIAMGLAAGCVVSWTPTWGLQILQCFVFCKIVRANFLASVIGTTFGNPWTFPILIWISHIVGSHFMDITGLDSYFDMIGKDTVVPDEHGYGVTAFVPTLVGGYIMAFVTYPLFYYGFYYLIEAGRAAKKRVGKTAHVLVEKVHDIKETRQEKRLEKKELKENCKE